ncbi:hypothetical protein CY35_07G085500 [Sphagnum magellanicum]|uniref:Uncharacterized protein n=1 Tax=Sphagnum magellanicum TaxID=128215 RepID=A0ACB8HMI9_9BRYO|nr:hypothetical protein CY35_07G085500 [Sphagnum magellanicum]
MESLAELSVLCERLYTSQDAAERAHAETTLACFSQNSEYISQCQYILENSSSPYTQFLASSSLVKQVTDHTLSLQLRLDIRNYVVGYLASKGQELQPFVATSLIQLLCRITKLGWYDDDQFRDIVKEAMKFLTHATVEHFLIGLKILNQLVTEMNQPNPGMSLTHHRKTACSFRDLALFQIFQISFTSLQQLQIETADHRLREQAITLSLKCFSFDFVGTSLDESSEDLGTIQIPSSWRPVLEDTSTMQLFFDYYARTKPPLSNVALECLVRLASVRRSLFSGELERSKFLSHLMSGTREILLTQQGLSEHENYHEYCRLLGRLKTNYQLSELMVLQNNITEDPLDNEEQLQDQLDSLPYLCRFQYEKTSNYIITLLEPILQAYTEAARLQTGVNNTQLQAMEGQLTWLVHIIGAIIRGRQTSSSSAESQEVIDGELAARVFQLIQVTDTGFHVQRYPQSSKQRLDLAILSFFQNFRRVYVGDQAMHSSKQLYGRLNELLGLQDHLMVLNVIVGKIATNLKCYAQCEEVIEQTLNLFQELAAGYMSGKLLLKLDAVNYILEHHTREHFTFLDEFKNSRNRTIFYFTLGRLLFMEDSSAKFKAFIASLQQVFVNLEVTPVEAFRSDGVKFALIGLMRDLRGIAMATNSRRTYGLLFEWLYPAHTSLLLRAIEQWTDTPEVTTPVLKFVAEFVMNKTQRLTFDSSCPNGILLFREVSKLIVAYGSRILSLPTPSDPYTYKYKGIWVALTILTRALAGNYVNFGVFELYGDRALADALDMALKMSLAIPLASIMAFRKLARAYFALLEVLCHNHTAVIVNLDTATFAHLVGSLETGVKSLDVNISSQCASAVDNLAAFYFNNITMEDNPTSVATINMARHFAECPNLFPEILKSLFEIVLFEECSNQWSLSRPMLSLILINEQIFNGLKAQILSTQPADQQQRLAGCFDKLMADITRTLEPKNRDKFTQNLTIFRHDFRAK